MKITQLPMSSINEATYNPRKISPDKFDALVRKIREFGLVDPLIVNGRTGNTLVGGTSGSRPCTCLGGRRFPV